MILSLAFCILGGSQKSKPCILSLFLSRPFAIHFWICCLGLSLGWHPSSIAPRIISSSDSFPLSTFSSGKYLAKWRNRGSWSVTILETIQNNPWSPVPRDKPEKGGGDFGIGVLIHCTMAWPHSFVLANETKYLLHPLIRNRNQTDKTLVGR